MDFSTLKSLTIPEGVVTQIADANGTVLWRAASSEATAKVGVLDDTSYSNANIDGESTQEEVEKNVP